MDDGRVREPDTTENAQPRRRRGYGYTDEQRVAAVALAATVGPNEAAARLDIPKQTVAGWTHEPAASPIIAEAERTIAQRLADAHAVALEQVIAGLLDPKARLLDKARALEVLGTQLALATGRATGNLNVRALGGYQDPLDGVSGDERLRAADFLDAILEAEAEYAKLSPDEQRDMLMAIAAREAASADQEQGLLATGED